MRCNAVVTGLRGRHGVLPHIHDAWDFAIGWVVAVAWDGMGYGICMGWGWGRSCVVGLFARYGQIRQGHLMGLNGLEDSYLLCTAMNHIHPSNNGQIASRVRFYKTVAGLDSVICTGRDWCVRKRKRHLEKTTNNR